MLAMSIFAIQLTNCQLYQPMFENKRHEGSAVTQYCGHHLSNALQFICEGKYHPMFKKNGQGMIKQINELINIINKNSSVNLQKKNSLCDFIYFFLIQYRKLMTMLMPMIIH